MYMYLFNQDGTTRIADTNCWGTNDPRVITIPNLNRGIYMVQLSRYDGASAGSLTTAFTPVPKVDAEPNDDITSVAPVAYNQSYAGHLGYFGNGWRDNLDYYPLDIPEDGALNVTVTGEPTGLFYINLYSMDGNTYTSISNSSCWGTAEPRSVGKANILAGKYLVGISRYDGYSAYSMDIQFKPNRSNDPPVNGVDWGQATEIALTPYTGMNYKGYVGHLGYDRNFIMNTNDYYKIFIPEDGSLYIQLQMDSSSLNYWRLYYDDLRTLAAGESSSWGSDGLRSIGST